MDQLGSVGFTAVQTLAPILDELAGANDVAQQGAVAHVGLVVQVGVPILIDSGHLWPIFWVRGADVLGAVQQKTLLEGGLFGVPWVGHALEPHSLPSAKVCRIQVREIKSGFVPSFQAGLLHRLSRRRVVGLLTHAMRVPADGIAGLGLLWVPSDEVVGVVSLS